LESVLLSIGQQSDQDEIADMISSVTDSNPDATQINLQEFVAMLNGTIEVGRNNEETTINTSYLKVNEVLVHNGNNCVTRA
jgi:Ca2+-binding EF-hand superfamily protein